MKKYLSYFKYDYLIKIVDFKSLLEIENRLIIEYLNIWKKHAVLIFLVVNETGLSKILPQIRLAIEILKLGKIS